ncbi:MAG: hypothetical protein ABIF19_09675 [Planctomycetota bacterium]
MRSALLAVAVVLSASSAVPADTWRLEDGRDWKAVSAGDKDRFLLAAAEIRRLVDSRQTEAAREAFDALKQDFPEMAGPDLDIFIKAEIYYCRGKLAKAVRSYDKLLSEHAKSDFRQAALEREFGIATGFLAGQKKTVLGIIRMRRYGEGIKIMEKITDRVGFDKPMGMEASLAVAKNYEEREKFNEAYLKWWEISLHRDRGTVGRDALLAMARCKRAVYNEHPEYKRASYDASCLSTAKSCYERFRLLYPEDAKKLEVDGILKEINEQLADKQLSIGRYYQRVGNRQSANLYFDMVAKDWPGNEAARTAKEMLAANQEMPSGDEAPPEK